MAEGWARYPANPSLLDDPFLGETLMRAERDRFGSAEMTAALAPISSATAKYMAPLRAHLKAARDAAVMIVAGTDVGNPYRFPGYSPHEELAFYVSAGMTPREALATATVNAARLAAWRSRRT